MARTVLSLREMTSCSGCTARTVRYYERQGLLHARRSAGGHRLFSRGELERLTLIVHLREAGWSLEDVSVVLGLRERSGSDHGSCAELAGLLGDHIRRLEQRLGSLRRLRDDLVAARDVLATCRACTVGQDHVVCEGCGRVPDLEDLPRSFRVIWRGGECRAGVSAADRQGRPPREGGEVPA
jgi:MerR family Zn(II)-responsive transcriptional regulator of zntA